MASLYEIMELPAFSSLERVKKQYKNLAFKYHPDAHRGDQKYEEKFKAIVKAYQVLSDPKQKLAYDQVLYSRLVRPTTSFAPKQETPKRKPPQRPYYRKKRSKANFHPVVWVVIFFGFGFILFQFIWQANNFMIAKKIETQMEARNILLEKAKVEAIRGNYDLALDYLELINYRQFDQDIRSLKSSLFGESEKKASELMQAGDFVQARQVLSFLISRGERVKEEWYVALAICYRRLGNASHSVELLENLLDKNPELLTANKEIAFIYKNDLGDFDRALFYLERSTAIIVNNYIDHYGKAYYVVIDPKNHPPSDFEVFLEKARVYSAFNKHKEAIDACKWAEVLKPESPEPNILMGYSYFEAGDYRNACKSVKKAKKKGAQVPEQLENLNC